jgi:aryl-alcohol dehydrogenase-like predicted oxidoreductase
MEYREFGKTGLKVSVVGFGAGHIGNPDQSEKDIEALLNELLEMGINLIDTARSYGESETRIGRHLGQKRTEFILSTKVGYTFFDKPDWSYDATMGTIDEALMRLRTDYLDIVHLHSCDKWFLEQGDAILALENAKEMGKIRVAAYSGENDALSFAIESGRFDSIQCSVNLFDQGSSKKLLPSAAGKGMGIIAKRPLGNAVWRYTSRPDGHGHAVYYDRFLQMNADTHGLAWPELALRFTAFSPHVSTLIAGTSDLKHLKEDLLMVEKGPLPSDVVKYLSDCFDSLGNNLPGLI